MTAVVGLTAGAIGVGLADDGVAVARSATEVSAPPARVALDVSESAPTETRVDNDEAVSDG